MPPTASPLRRPHFFLLIFLLAGALSSALSGMGILPDPKGKALRKAGEQFRAGDLSRAAATLQPWIKRSDEAAREALALRFLAQDFPAALSLSAEVPGAAKDDEARLWVARCAAALGDWGRCLDELEQLGRPQRPLAQYLRAEALDAQGDSTAAEALGQALSATAGTRYEALACLLAAESAERRSDDEAAEGFYKRCEKADPAYTLVHLRLAALYRRHERWKEARQRLERARKVDPEAEGPRQALNALLAAMPEQRKAIRRDEERKVKQFVGRRLPQVEPLPRRRGEPLVRVGLLNSVARFKFKLGGAYACQARGLTLPAGSSWEARAGPRGAFELRSLSPAAKRTLKFEQGPLRLEPQDEDTTFGVYGVDLGTGYFFSRAADRSYRGLLELRNGEDGGLTLVDELGMEAYLLSVVPGELPPHWPEAALRAQAIAARTDAWRSLGRFKGRGYDLCPTVLCAAYNGVGSEDPRTTEAVTATAGLVLEGSRSKLAATFYMDNSGGYTQASSEAWTQRQDGSVGVPDCPPGAKATLALFPVTAASLLHFIDDPDDDVQAWPKRSGGSLWRWVLRLTPEELAPSVDRRHGVGRLKTVLGLKRSAGGYLHDVRIVGEAGESEASSDRVRSALKGLKSNLFYVEPRLDAAGRTQALLFFGGGWGHGVGMSQTGARAMAEAGMDEAAVLKHYFPNAKLKKRYPR